MWLILAKASPRNPYVPISHPATFARDLKATGLVTATGDRRTEGRTEAEDRELAVLQWSADFLGPTALRSAS